MSVMDLDGKAVADILHASLTLTVLTRQIILSQ